MLKIFSRTLLSNQRLFNFNFKPQRPLNLTLSLMAAATTSAASSPTNVAVKRVGTHNGSFHCDEALGCFMIRLTNKFSNAQIIRSRDPQVLEELDAVLDVGGVYEPTQDRYDHHQKGFEEVFGHGFDTKLSSAGLVYKDSENERVHLTVPGKDESNDVVMECTQGQKNCIPQLRVGANGTKIDDDLRYILESDSTKVEELMKKYSDELSTMICHMEQKLEELLDIVMSSCRMNICIIFTGEV